MNTQPSIMRTNNAFSSKPATAIPLMKNLKKIFVNELAF